MPALLGLLAVIFLTMSLMFTSVKGGIISLVPSVVPIVLLLVRRRHTLDAGAYADLKG